MDKKTLLAMVLIAIILLLMPFYNEKILGLKEPNSIPTKDSSEKVISKPQEKTEPKKPVIQEPVYNEVSQDKKKTDNTEKFFKEDSTEKIIKIETDKYILKISNRGGGGLKSFRLKKYETYDSSMVNLIDSTLNNGITLTFQDESGEYVDTKDVLFSINDKRNYIRVSDGNNLVLTYTTIYKNTQIKKTFTFLNNVYSFNLSVGFTNAYQTLLNDQYQINWINGVPCTESYKQDDSRYKQVYAYMADELEHFEVDDEGQTETTTYSGKADWIALRTKYFAASISVIKADVSNGVYFKGTGIKYEDYLDKLYDAGFLAKYDNSHQDEYQIYIGPLDRNQLSQYGNHLDDLVMNNGWYEKVFRPFSFWLILPILGFFHSFIPNYGLVIIIFSILIKIILYPLTKKSYSSTRKMQLVQPRITQLKEKYKNDPQRLSSETMKMYKELGINPLGGCLPSILQMPLLVALFIVFRSTIQLRGAMFIPGWIPDLSRPDALFILPFSLPFYGNEFNLLPILMAVTMFFQSKMTMQDPKQKAMIYVMPIFMLFIFNHFPSGLNLYYTMFNLLTIIQQKYLHPADEPLPVKTVKKK